MGKNQLSENQFKAIAEEMAAKPDFMQLKPEDVAPALRAFWKRRRSSVPLNADDEHLRYVYERLLESEWTSDAFLTLRDEQTPKHKKEWEARDLKDKPKVARAAPVGVPRIIGYRVLSNKIESGLADEVVRYINQGWQPLGGVAAAAFGISPVGGNRFVQAIVRYGKS